MQSLTKVFLLLLFIGPFSALGLNGAVDEDVSRALMQGAGIATDSSLFLEAQLESRKEEFNVLSTGYFAAQSEIWENSNGGPILHSLGIDAFALVKNPYAQTLHFIVSIWVMAYMFIAAANPNGKGRPNGKTPDFHMFLGNFSIKVVVGIIVMGYPQMIYSTSMALKNSASMIVSYAISADASSVDPDEKATFQEKLGAISDEQLVSWQAFQAAVNQAVEDRIKAMVGGEVEAYTPRSGVASESVIEDYTLAYLGQLGAEQNKLLSKSRQTYEAPVSVSETTARDEAIRLIRLHLRDTLLHGSIIPKNHSSVRLSLPTYYYYSRTPTGKYYDTSDFTMVDADFRNALEPVFEYRDELIKEYSEGPGRTWYLTKKDSDEDAVEHALSLREILMDDYYAKVYTATVDFIDSSLGGYLKKTPHAGYVSQRLGVLGSAKANLKSPEERLNVFNSIMVWVRSFVQKIMLWIGFTLFEGVIEISIVLLWMVYPLWFYHGTAGAFTGRAKNIYTLCIVSAVFVFLLSVVEALTAQFNYMAYNGGFDLGMEGVAGAVAGATIGVFANSMTAGVLVFYVVACGLCLYMAPKITSAIFKGTSIVGTLAGGLVTAGMAGAAVAATTATGGFGAAGGKTMLAKATKRFAERRAMGGSRISAGLGSILPRMNRAGSTGVVSNAVRNPATKAAPKVKPASPASRMGIVPDSDKSTPPPPTREIPNSPENTAQPEGGAPKTKETVSRRVFRETKKASKAATREIFTALSSGGDPSTYMQMRKNATGGGKKSAEEELDDI